MSAYASSSSFFFPSFSSLYSSTKDTKVVANSCDEISTSSSSSLTASSSTLSSSPRANDDDLNEKQQCNESDGNHETTNSWYNSSQDMFISIKSASIDPIRYIQSLTTRRPSGTSNDLASPPRSIGVNSVRRDSTISTLSSSSPSNAMTRRDSIRETIVKLSNNLTGMSTTASSICDSEEQWGEYGETPHSSPANGHNQREQFQARRNSSKVFTFDMDESEEKNNESYDEKSCDHNSFYASVGEGYRVPHFVASTSPKTDESSSKLSSPHSHSTKRRGSKTSSKSHLNKSNSQDDAIQFTLSITLNGRMYTATRTLPSFVKLRNELMLEVSNQNNSKRKLGRSLNDSNHDSVDNLVGDDVEDDEVEPEEVVIPELPLSGGNAFENNGTSKVEELQNSAFAMMGMAANGFSGIQAVLHSYCPQMENWIRNVATLVPCSPSLANFLWEPLQSNTNGNMGGKVEVVEKTKEKDKVYPPLKSLPNANSTTSTPLAHAKRKSSFASSHFQRGSICTLNSIHEDSDDSEDESSSSDDDEE